MTQPNQTPTTIEITPHHVMAMRVQELLRRHPLLQPLRDAGASVLVGCQVEAIFAQVRLQGADGHKLETRIEQTEWWVQRIAHWPERLAQRLAMELRARWDQHTAVAAK